MSSNEFRYISNLTKETYALVLAGGQGSRLHELTQWRAKPALYFGGKFRIVDFALSNCINSGIRRVGVLTQYKSYSLIRHLMRNWSHFKLELGESVEVLPASQRYGQDWYQGTADAVAQNIDIICQSNPKYVMILSGDHVYRMDYGALLAQHVESGADMTCCCKEVPIHEAAGAFGVMEIDDQNRILGFEEKPEHPRPVPGSSDMCMASMGNYVFNTEFLIEQLLKDAADPTSEHDFGKNIIPKIVENSAVYAHRFRSAVPGNDDYWRDVGTLDSFWLANMELLAAKPPMDMYDEKWPIWTYQEQQPPGKLTIGEDGQFGSAMDSMLSAGVWIQGGSVKHSVLFNSVQVGCGSVIDESVILPNVTVGKNVKITKAIVDSRAIIPDGMEIGVDHEQDRQRGFRVSSGGVVLVTAGMLKKLVGKDVQHDEANEPEEQACKLTMMEKLIRQGGGSARGARLSDIVSAMAE